MTNKLEGMSHQELVKFISVYSGWMPNSDLERELLRRLGASGPQDLQLAFDTIESVACDIHAHGDLSQQLRDALAGIRKWVGASGVDVPEGYWSWDNIEARIWDAAMQDYKYEHNTLKTVIQREFEGLRKHIAQLGLRDSILAELPSKPIAMLTKLCYGRFSEVEAKETLSQMIAEDVIELTPDRVIRVKPAPPEAEKEESPK